MPVSQCVQVQTAAGTRDEAAAIADALLSRRLAACVQIVGPIQSRYWWQGELESAEEWLCLAKTTTERADAVVAAVGEVHSYETPEIVVTAILGGSDAYLQWVAGEVAAS